MSIMTGIYEKTIFRNDKNGFAVFLFNTKDYDSYKDAKGYIVCAGNIPVYTKGVPLRLNGLFVYQNSEYTFNINNIEEYSNQRNITITYISGENFHGIGEKTAEKIINITGPDIFTFVQRDDAEKILSDNITELKGKKAFDFISEIKRTSVQKEIYNYVYRFGGRYANATKLYELYGRGAMDKLTSNPYSTGTEAGLSFCVCDAIAKEQGISAYDERRIEALFETSMKYADSSGHTYSLIDDVYKTANLINKRSAYPFHIPASLLIRAAYRLEVDYKKVETERGNPTKYYLKRAWTNTNEIVKHVKRIQNSAVKMNFDDALINEAESAFSIKYSEKQRLSFDFLKKTGIKVLTGGPGTGKTTVINGLINAYKSMYPNSCITLCAPTGRAAQRMSESTGCKASTIHRLLEIKPYGTDMVYRNQIDPLPSDLLIVDEMSMADEEIFSMLMGAVKNGATVILSGDIDQLPSVGAGNVLSDLIASNLFEVNKLDVIYRQIKDSIIIKNAIKINTGRSDITSGPDFEIINAKTDTDMLNEIKRFSAEYYVAGDPFSFQVLSSTKKGLAGTRKINIEMQDVCNPGVPKARYGQLSFRIGDKVMMIKNNYDIGYFNGDVGIIKEITDSKIIVEIGEETKEVPRTCYCDIALAYGITIHKSQGAEYSTVVISLPKDPSVMLKRNLLFTAITRAKKKVIIITQEDAMQTAINTIDGIQRKTSLSPKLSRLTNIQK